MNRNHRHRKGYQNHHKGYRKRQNLCGGEGLSFETEQSTP